MDSHPLPPDKRVMFNALIHVPDVGPAQAHAIAEEYGSFGNLIANLLDPSACAPCPALSQTPAHAITEESCSFGNLIANLLDPSACVLLSCIMSGQAYRVRVVCLAA